MSDLGTQADERTMLTGFLDWYRGVAEHKLDGLALGDATMRMTPTHVCMLGIIKHLAWVETGWFRVRFVGEQLDRPENPESFHLTLDDTVESVLAAYGDACARSRRITDDAGSLDAPAATDHPIYGSINLRWILLHMTEETARHAGHLDIMRELIDGRTGD